MLTSSVATSYLSTALSENASAYTSGLKSVTVSSIANSVASAAASEASSVVVSAQNRSAAASDYTAASTANDNLSAYQAQYSVAVSTYTSLATAAGVSTTLPGMPAPTVASVASDQWSGNASGILMLDASHPLTASANQLVNEVVALADLKDGSGKNVSGSQEVKAYLYANGELISQGSVMIDLMDTPTGGFGQVAVPINFDASQLAGAVLTAGFCVGDPIGTNTPDGTATGGTQNNANIAIPSTPAAKSGSSVSKAASTVKTPVVSVTAAKPGSVVVKPTSTVLPATGESSSMEAVILGAMALVGGLGLASTQLRKKNI